MSAASAPRKAKLRRVRGVPILRTRDRSAPLAVATTAKGHSAAASDAVEAQQRFLAIAAHELHGSVTFQRTLAEEARAHPSADAAGSRETGKRVVTRCMRSLGSPTYPDPTVSSQGIGYESTGAGAGSNSPLHQRILEACLGVGQAGSSGR